MNRKGGFTDLFIFMIIAFVLMLVVGIFVYIGATAYSELREQFSQQEDSFENQNVTQTVENTLGEVPVAYSVLYWGSIILLFGMVMGIFVSSYLVTTRPIFFVPYIILVFVAIIVSVPIANVYEEVITNPTLASSFNNFVGSNYFMLYLPYIVSVVGVVGGIIMFASMKRGQNEQAYIGG